MSVSLDEKLIYAQTNNGVAYDGIDCELALGLMAEQQDAAAVDGNDVATTTLQLNSGIRLEQAQACYTAFMLC
jgi:hypothetical protein